jgi:16S rRNA (adenine1518-N6/adenine1519-N6)-dimethyltransferase
MSPSHPSRRQPWRPSTPAPGAAPRRPPARTSAGQHFLTDGRVMTKIVDAIAAAPGETVIEVGAGHGNLTKRILASGARVVAVEIDRRCEPHLTRLQEEFPRLAVVWGDALTLEWEPLWEGTPQERRVVAGNIPYQITSPLLARLSDERRAFGRAVLMIQREVAHRLAAGPGSRERGPLGVKVALDLEAKVLFGVKREAFRPKPQVESAVVGLTPLALPPVANEEERLLVRRVVEAAFGSRRQQVANSLAGHFAPPVSKARWVELLGQAGIEATVRAEAIGLDQFIALARLVA